jgi:HPt (histidine-containing phosphotransfer) domain-containing protein
MILMDVNLPDMDGFKATAAIRACERGGRRTPIVALTGSTLPGDREKCLASGMDDFLSKPIDLGQLCSMVERMTSQAGEKDPVARKALVDRAASAVDRYSIQDELAISPLDGLGLVSIAPDAEGLTAWESQTRIDVAPLDAANVESVHADGAAPLSDGFGAAGEVELPPIDAARLQEASMGIPALRDALLQTFLADVEPRMQRMTEALMEADPRRIEFEAHSLRGMCGTIGAMRCSELFAQIEQLAGDEQLGNVSGMFDRARSEVERVGEYVKRLGQVLNRAA